MWNMLFQHLAEQKHTNICSNTYRSGAGLLTRGADSNRQLPAYDAIAQPAKLQPLICKDNRARLLILLRICSDPPP